MVKYDFATSCNKWSGQFEMAMRPQKGIKASDNAFLYKQTVKVRNFSGRVILVFNSV